jgi:hypothetical protein
MTASAQNTGVQLSGQVLDATSKEKIPYVTVIANTPDNVFVEGSATDDDGKFMLMLPKGKYVLQFSFIGYQNTEKEIDLSGKQQLEILIDSDIVTLENIVISGERTSVV